MATKKRKVKDSGNLSLLDFDTLPNTEVFSNEFDVFSSAAIGVVVVRTKEPQRAVEALFENAVRRNASKFRVWMVTEGWRDYRTTATVNADAAAVRGRLEYTSDGVAITDIANPEEQEFVFDLYNIEQGLRNTADPTRAMSHIIDAVQTEGEAVSSINVMLNPDFAFGQPGFHEYLKIFMTRSLENDARLVLILQHGTEIPEDVAADIKVMDFLVPSASELYDVCKETFESLDFQTDDDDITEGVNITEEDLHKIVQNALGMTRNEFTTALSLGIVRQSESLKDGEELDVPAIVQEVQTQKTEIVRSSQTLEILKPVDIDKVGGLDILKNYITKRKAAFGPKAREFGVDVPKGILVCGIPGAGKSLLAKATASILDIPCIAFDIGKVFGGLVGQSESQMRSSLAQIDAMAPCVVLMDEVDKGFSNTSGGGDSGTSARVFGTFLSWMQERKPDKPVFVVMTANNVDHLPPELVRKGRLDEIFCATFPNIEEREAIFNIHMSQRGHEFDASKCRAVLSATNEYVGAEIESIVKDAILEAFTLGLDAPTPELLLATAEGIKPLSKTFATQVDRMNEWAKNNAKAASSGATFDGSAVVKSSNGINGPKRSKKRTFKLGKSASTD